MRQEVARYGAILFACRLECRSPFARHIRNSHGPNTPVQVKVSKLQYRPSLLAGSVFCFVLAISSCLFHKHCSSSPYCAILLKLFSQVSPILRNTLHQE